MNPQVLHENYIKEGMHLMCVDRIPKNSKGLVQRNGTITAGSGLH